MVMLETLTPEERAVFILREAFDYNYHEISAIVDTRTAGRLVVVPRSIFLNLAGGALSIPSRQRRWFSSFSRPAATATSRA
jgi:hypothetical protein